MTTSFISYQHCQVKDCKVYNKFGKIWKQGGKSPNYLYISQIITNLNYDKGKMATSPTNKSTTTRKFEKKIHTSKLCYILK